MPYSSISGIQLKTSEGDNTPSDGISLGSGVFSIQEICYHQWLQDYKLYGQDSSTYKRPDVWENFITSPVAIYDKDISPLSIDYVLNKGGHIGKYIKALNGIGDADWDNLPTVQSIYEDDDAFNAVINNSYALDMLFTFNNCEIMDYTNLSLLNIVQENSTYMDEFITSRTQVETTSTYDGICLLLYINDGCDVRKGGTYQTTNNTYNMNIWASGTATYTKMNDEIVTVYTERTQELSWSNNGLTLRESNPNLFVKKIQLIPKTYSRNYSDFSLSVTAYPKAKYIPITLYR